MDPNDPNFIRLQQDIDLRCLDIWVYVEGWMDPEETGDRDRSIFASCLRAAYEKGYRQSIVDCSKSEIGKLYIDNGFSLT